MSFFAATGVTTPLLAAGLGVTVTDGMLAGHLLADPAVFLGDDASLTLGLRSLQPIRRTEALARAATDVDLQAAIGFVRDVSAGVEPAEGTATASLERAQRLVRQTERRVERALADPMIPVTYRNLLQRLLTEQPDLVSGDPAVYRALGGAAAELVDQLVADVTQAHATYNGWQSLEAASGTAQIAALGTAIEALYGEVVAEAFQNGILREALGALLAEHRPELVTEFSDLGNLTLVTTHHQVQSEFATSLPGSTERVDGYWRLIAIRHEMLSRDNFDHVHFREVQVELAHPYLTRGEQERLITLNHRAENRVDRADRLFHHEVLDGIRYFYRQGAAIDAVTDPDRKFGYADVVQQLSALAIQLGIETEDIHWATSGDRRPPSIQPTTLADVQAEARELDPAALPAEVRRCLEATGHWDMVARRARRVILMPELSSSDQIRNLVGSVPHGRAFFADGTVVVATRSRDAKSGELFNLQPWQIAGLIAHETAHLNWMEEIADNPDRRLLMANVPNEREAHAEEVRFYRRYLEIAGAGLSPLDRISLEQNIYGREAIVYACNLLMGLPLRDLELGRQELPPAENFARFGVEGMRALDLNPYPTSLQALIGRVEFSNAFDRMELADLRTHLSQRLDDLAIRYRALESQIRGEIERRRARRGAGAGEDLERLAAILPQQVVALRAQYTDLFGLNAPA